MNDSTTTTVKPGLDNANAVWDLLAERIDALVSAWEAGSGPPDLADFVPVASPAVRRLALCELAKIDMEHRRSQGTGCLVEEYVERYPELGGPAGVPCDLIYEEYHLRRRAGESVTAADYLTRFPRQADELRRLMNLPGSERTTSLFVPVVSADLEVGETIDDFDLLTQLGRGAFATVFLARQRSLKRLVALKASADAGTEPQTLAQLEHPHIVRVYDQRLVPERELRLLYMQYVPGGTLQDVVRRAKELAAGQRNGRTVLLAVDDALDRAGQSPPGDSSARQAMANLTWPHLVCRIGQQLASALDYAHRRGVLHRDLKPANVLMTAEGSPRLADFNISFCSKLDGASPAAYFGGSLAYMSPEQLEACSPQYAREPDSLDGRSDVYSLGVVLWELLTGSRPFSDEPLEAGWNATVDAMLGRRHLGLSAMELERLPKDLPLGMVELLRDCLAPVAEDRCANAAEVAARLRLCQRPDAQRLLAASRRGWAAAVRRFSTIAVVLVAVAANGPVAWFNYKYNHQQIIDHLKGAERQFQMIMLATNSVAFSLGIAILVGYARPVARALGVIGLRKRKSIEASGVLPQPPREGGGELAAVRIRALRLGHFTAVLGIVEWAIAGVSYPVLLQAFGVKIDPSEWAPFYVHFVLSLALCGMIAATYPFFGITWLVVRAMYAPLVPAEPPGGDAVELETLSRRTWRYLVMGASVPMLAVALLASLRTSEQRLALGVLSAGSLAGFGLIFYLARAIQADLAALVWMVRPNADSEAADTGSFVVAPEQRSGGPAKSNP